MDSLMTWSLAVLGYLGGVWLMLWFMQRVEAGLDEGRRGPIAVRGQQRRPPRASATVPDDGPRSPVRWGL